MHKSAILTAGASIPLALALAAGPAGAAGSEQVVFSIAPQAVQGVGPMGFWIWCEAESSNPYVGACNGSIYLYESTPVEHVAPGIGTIAETPPDSGIYTITVTTNDIACTLTNETADAHGSHQKIDVTCTSPTSGSGTAVGTVNVTG